MKLQKRFEFAIPETVSVALWVFVSAGLTAIISWALQKPEYLQYYGALNVLLYFLNELKKGKETK
jgi:hypothetical protein